MKIDKRNITFKDIEIRSANEEGKKFVEGIIPYNSKSVPIWGTTEIIDKTAFNKTLADKSEVRALWNHDDNKVLGSTKSSTLKLENQDMGLICRCELPNTSYANDLFEIINRGDVKTMSFGFTPIKWIDDNSGKLRTLKEVQLHEVSFGVVHAAYKETSSQTYLRGLEKNNIDIEKLNEVLEKNELIDKDKQAIKETVDKLNSIIGIEAVKKEPTNVTPKIENTSEPVKVDTTAIELQIEAEINA